MKVFLTRHWPLIGIGMLLIVVGFYLFKAWNGRVRAPIVTEVSLEEGLKLKNIHYTQDNPDEGLKWVLDAKEVRFSNDRQLISFKNFRLRLEPENRPSIEMEGKMGDYNKESGEINLRGDLKGFTDNGYRIIAQHIVFRQKEGSLKTEEPVKITGPFFSVDGKGLHFSLKRETLKIISGVTTLIQREQFVL